jgi:alkylation response protein AidB-like acyl-CoA dehydrogenase
MKAELRAEPVAADVQAEIVGDLLAELRHGVGQALDALAPVTRTLQLLEAVPPYDEKVWRRLSEELSLPGVAVPEELGGQGFGSAEQGAVLEELGRVLYAGPYLASAVLAAGALQLAGDREASARWLPGLSDGSRLGAVALEDGPLPVTTTEERAGRVRLNGQKVAVIGGVGADLLITIAHGADGPAIVAVELPLAGVRVEPVPVMDLTRPLATVTFDGASGFLVHPSRPQVPCALRRLLASAVASEQVGAARGALDAALSYARTRVQFGREIGTFQAVRHRLADLYAEVEIATAAARAAAGCTDLASREGAILVDTATSICSETLLTVAEEVIQLHGGIGFTWEHPAHLFLKRAKSSEILVGGAEAARGRLLDALAAV